MSLFKVVLRISGGSALKGLKSKIKGSNFKICKLSKIAFSMIGHKSHENYVCSVYKCQQAEITLVFVPTPIHDFTFSYTTDIK